MRKLITPTINVSQITMTIKLLRVKSGTKYIKVYVVKSTIDKSGTEHPSIPKMGSA